MNYANPAADGHVSSTEMLDHTIGGGEDRFSTPRLGVHNKDQVPDLANKQLSFLKSFHHVHDGMSHHQRLYLYNIERGSREILRRSRRLHEKEETNKKANR